jgi:hypothetical protein
MPSTATQLRVGNRPVFNPVDPARVVDTTGADGKNGPIGIEAFDHLLDGLPDDFSFYETCPADKASFLSGMSVAFDDWQYRELVAARAGNGGTDAGGGPVFYGRIWAVERDIVAKQEVTRYRCRGGLQEFATIHIADALGGPDQGVIGRIVINADTDDADFPDNAIPYPATLHQILSFLENAYGQKLFRRSDGTGGPLFHTLVPGAALPWLFTVPSKTVGQEITLYDYILLLIKNAQPGIHVAHHYEDALPGVHGSGNSLRSADQCSIGIDIVDTSDLLNYPDVPGISPNERFRYDADSRAKVLKFSEDATGRFNRVEITGRKRKVKHVVAKYVDNIATIPLFGTGGRTDEATQRYVLIAAWDRSLEPLWTCAAGNANATAQAVTDSFVSGPGETRRCGGTQRTVAGSLKVQGTPFIALLFNCGHVKVTENVPTNPRTFEAEVVSSFQSYLNVDRNLGPNDAWVNQRGHKVEVTARSTGEGGNFRDVFTSYIVVDTSRPAGGVIPPPWKYEPITLDLSALEDDCCPGYFVRAAQGPSSSPNYFMQKAGARIFRDVRRLTPASPSNPDVNPAIALSVLQASVPSIKDLNGCNTPGGSQVNPVQELRFCARDRKAIGVAWPRNGSGGTPHFAGEPGQEPSTYYAKFGLKETYRVVLDDITEELIGPDEGPWTVDQRNARIALEERARAILRTKKDIIYRGEVQLPGIDYRWLLPIVGRGNPNVEPNFGLVDFYIGGKLLVEAALHLQHKFDYQNDTTTISLSTDLVRGSDRVEEAIRLLRDRQRIKDQERTSHKLATIGKCEAGGIDAGNGSGGLGGGDSGGGGSGGSGGGGGGGGGGPSAPSIPIPPDQWQLLKWKSENWWGNPPELALLSLDMEALSEAGPTPGIPIADAANIEANIPDALSARAKTGVFSGQNDTELLIPIRFLGAPPGRRETTPDLKQIVVARGLLDSATMTVRLHPTQYPIEPAMTSIGDLTFRAITELYGWVHFGRARFIDPTAGPGNAPWPPGWISTTDTWATYCQRNGININQFPTPESAGKSINEGSVDAIPPGIGTGNVGVPYYLPQATTIPRRQRWLILNSRGVYPARLTASTPWPEPPPPPTPDPNPLPPDFPVLELDPNRNVRDIFATVGLGSVLARLFALENGSPIAPPPGFSPDQEGIVAPPSILAGGSALESLDTTAAALNRTSKESYLIYRDLEDSFPTGNRHGKAIKLDGRNQWIEDEDGRVPIGGWPSGVSAAELRTLYGLVFLPKQAFDERDAGDGASHPEAGLDAGGLGNFGAAFQDSTGAYFIANEDGVWAAQVVDGKLQLDASRGFEDAVLDGLWSDLVSDVAGKVPLGRRLLGDDVVKVAGGFGADLTADRALTITTFGAASASAAGTRGAVLAPAAGDQAKVLLGNRTWSSAEGIAWDENSVGKFWATGVSSGAAPSWRAIAPEDLPLATNLLQGAIVLAGQLGGFWDAPDVRGIRETGGPTLLTNGAIPANDLLQRIGSTLVGSSGATGAGTAMKLGAATAYTNANLLGGNSLYVDRYISAASGFLSGTIGLELMAFGAAALPGYMLYGVGSHLYFTSVNMELAAGGDITLSPTGGIKFGAHYWDVAQMSAPSAPASGTRRLFVDSATGLFGLIRSDSSRVVLEPQGVSVAFTDGDTSRRVSVTDARVSAGSKIVPVIRRPDYTSDATDPGFIYVVNVVYVYAGGFDAVVTALDTSGLDPSDDPPNETVTLIYTVG